MQLIDLFAEVDPIEIFRLPFHHSLLRSQINSSSGSRLATSHENLPGIDPCDCDTYVWQCMSKTEAEFRSSPLLCSIFLRFNASQRAKIFM